jgi:hypothetical protein
MHVYNRSEKLKEGTLILTDPEHDTDDAEDDGNETGVIDGEILRGHYRRHVGLRRRRLTWIVHRRCVPVRRHLSPLFDRSLCLSLRVTESKNGGQGSSQETWPTKITSRVLLSKTVRFDWFGFKCTCV